MEKSENSDEKEERPRLCSKLSTAMSRFRLSVLVCMNAIGLQYVHLQLVMSSILLLLSLAWQELRRCRLISIIEVEFRNVDAAAVVSPPVKFFT